MPWYLGERLPDVSIVGGCWAWRCLADWSLCVTVCCYYAYVFWLLFVVWDEFYCRPIGAGDAAALPLEAEVVLVPAVYCRDRKFC
jgi:hypothetical protein